MRRSTCVFCASSDRIENRYIELATEVGSGIAQRDHILVSGGGSVSMMGAVARAARGAGGHTVGVIPQALIDLEMADHDANELIVTPDMRTRKAEMDRQSDVFLALPGGIGTLEELTEVWTAFTLGMHAKPVIVLDPWGDYTYLHALIDHLVNNGFVREDAARAIHWVHTIDQALALVDEHTGARNEGPAAQADEALESAG